MIAVCAVCRYAFLVKKTMRMMKMEVQHVIQNKLAYMDSLSRANGAGHKVDSELKEIVQSLREDLDIVDSNKKLEKAVKERSDAIGMTIAQKFIKKLQVENLINYTEAKVVDERLWELFKAE